MGKGNVLGHGIVVFSIDEFIDSLNEGRVNYRLITDKKSDVLNNIEYNSLNNIDEQYFYAYKLSGIRDGLICKIDDAVLFEETNKTQKSIIVCIIILFVISVILSHIFIVRKTDNIISQLDYMSFHDTLSDLYKYKIL
ncbi:hypothetical protein MWH25_11210 [Natroniella acetigena]|uniref:hypothetical protein n=1 Tax=Natroniella acetigena TaxID=52004 RepID=UPI00200AD866|nr:hypothetical protein [Natroniella acetigena]MCK8828301.1 hypothetical protein [Natroniella acetigena]